MWIVKPLDPDFHRLVMYQQKFEDPLNAVNLCPSGSSDGHLWHRFRMAINGLYG